MLDVVVVAMGFAIPALFLSIWLVRQRKLYRHHKVIQLTLATILGLAIILFEIEIRCFGWRDRAVASEFWQDGPFNDAIDMALVTHLMFAVPTFLLWIVVVIRAWRGFPRPPTPGDHSKAHRFWGRLGAAGLTLTTVTGWWFYYVSFVR